MAGEKSIRRTKCTGRVDNCARLLYNVRKYYILKGTVMKTDCTTTENIPDSALSESLSATEAAKRKAEGHANVTKEKNGKSYPEIIFGNLFTFFNLVWAAIAVLMIVLKSYQNLNFLFVIVPNVLIAIIQECRAKRTVEKLSVTTDPHADVVRDGALVRIVEQEIVLGDVMCIEMGQQILSDAVVLSGVAEANESMLTGESNAIRKGEGDRLLAGSFLVSGRVFAKVTHVGKDNYVHKIEKAAKSFKTPASDLFRDLNKLLKYIAIFMVPMAVAMFVSNYFASGHSLETAILKTCGSVIGMIPAGIYLLVTVTLTLSVMTLAQKRTLVQDMYSIEMLARADVVCLDKTGTITDGTMCVSDLLPLADVGEDSLCAIIRAVEGTEESVNPTSRALIERFGADRSVTVLEKVPFSSERKYSAVTLETLGTYAVGAPHFVPCPIDEETEGKIAAYAAEGKRVLVLAQLPAPGVQGRALALIAVTDRIRPNAKETIEKFQSQDVTVKIISGDHAATVSAIAARVGVKHADRYLSCENVSDEELAAAVDNYAVFGRVTPEQKVLLVKELKKRGHTVAMTGDGVNDTLALKESNCAIAMAEGSEMARKISQIVLLDSDFGTLPDVVREGRRCINNVRQSATLFLMKTVMTILLSVYAVCTVTVYPFSPNHTMLLELFIIGIAAVLLALEPNNKRIEGSFIRSVLIKSAPYAVAMFLPVLTLLLLHSGGVIADRGVRDALATVAMTSAGFMNLVILCRPYTKWRAVVVVFTGVATLLTVFITIFLVNDMVGLRVLGDHIWLTLLVIFGSMLFSVLVALFMRFVVARLWKRKKKKVQ